MRLALIPPLVLTSTLNSSPSSYAFGTTSSATTLPKRYHLLKDSAHALPALDYVSHWEAKAAILLCQIETGMVASIFNVFEGHSVAVDYGAQLFCWSFFVTSQHSLQIISKTSRSLRYTRRCAAGYCTPLRCTASATCQSLRSTKSPSTTSTTRPAWRSILGPRTNRWSSLRAPVRLRPAAHRPLLEKVKFSADLRPMVGRRARYSDASSGASPDIRASINRCCSSIKRAVLPVNIRSLSTSKSTCFTITAPLC